MSTGSSPPTTVSAVFVLFLMFGVGLPLRKDAFTRVHSVPSLSPCSPPRDPLCSPRQSPFDFQVLHTHRILHNYINSKKYKREKESTHCLSLCLFVLCGSVKSEEQLAFWVRPCWQTAPLTLAHQAAGYLPSQCQLPFLAQPAASLSPAYLVFVASACLFPGFCVISLTTSAVAN